MLGTLWPSCSRREPVFQQAGKLEGLCQKGQRFCVPQRTGTYGSGIGLLSLPLHRLAGALCLLDFAMFQKHFHGLPDREPAGDNSFPA